MAQVTVYVPDKLWDEYRQLREEQGQKGDEEPASTSGLFRAAIQVAVDEMKRQRAPTG